MGGVCDTNDHPLHTPCGALQEIISHLNTPTPRKAMRKYSLIYYSNVSKRGLTLGVSLWKNCNSYCSDIIRLA